MKAERWFSMRPGFWVMLGGLAVTVFFVQFGAPPGNPPGKRWGIEHSIGVGILLIAAALAGWRGLKWYEALVLGLLGAAFFDVWLPDWRRALYMGVGSRPALNWYVRYVIFVAIIGAGCAWLAHAGGVARRVFPTRERSANCRNCGYLLHGLPERRCPECGTGF